MTAYTSIPFVLLPIAMATMKPRITIKAIYATVPDCYVPHPPVRVRVRDFYVQPDWSISHPGETRVVVELVSDPDRCNATFEVWRSEVKNISVFVAIEDR